MSQVLTWWQRAVSVPVAGPRLGAQVFSLLFARQAPYFATVRPRFTVVEPNRVELVVRDRRRVHNHLGTVHAIALCNGLEAAMGALAEATIPADRRWIPKGMEVAYTAKAVGDITCVAETDPGRGPGDALRDTGSDLPVRVRGVDRDGVVVVEGEIRLWVTPRRRPTPATAAASATAS